jgi:hypothetical protein
MQYLRLKKPNTVTNKKSIYGCPAKKTKFPLRRPGNPKRFCSVRSILTEVHAVSTPLTSKCYRTTYFWFFIHSSRPAQLSLPSNRTEYQQINRNIPENQGSVVEPQAVVCGINKQMLESGLKWGTTHTCSAALQLQQYLHTLSPGEKA